MSSATTTFWQHHLVLSFSLFLVKQIKQARKHHLTQTSVCPREFLSVGSTPTLPWTTGREGGRERWGTCFPQVPELPWAQLSMTRQYLGCTQLALLAPICFHHCPLTSLPLPYQMMQGELSSEISTDGYHFWVISIYSLWIFSAAEKAVQCCTLCCSPRPNVPGPLQGHLWLHKTTPHCRSTPQACDTRIRSLVKHSKNKSNTVVSVLLKTLRFTPQRIKSGKNP